MRCRHARHSGHISRFAKIVTDWTFAGRQQLLHDAGAFLGRHHRSGLPRVARLGVETALNRNSHGRFVGFYGIQHLVKTAGCRRQLAHKQQDKVPNLLCNMK